MFFEIYRQGKVVKRGNRLLNETIDFSNELMTTPEMSLSLPIEYLEYIAGREQFKLFTNDKCFWGIIKSVEPNMAEQKVDITVAHHIDEWNNRQVSINNAVSDQAINVVMIPKRSQTADMIIRNNLANKEQMVGYKIRIKYSQFKGKTVKQVEDWIADYAKDKDIVRVISLEPPYEDKAKPKFVSSTIKYVKYKTKKGGHIKVGTYTATFESKAGSKIKIPISISYSIKKSGASKPDEIETTPEIEDEIDNILNDENFAYFGWDVNFEEGTEDTRISYVYSRQSKYEALTKTVELTDDLFWRVGFTDTKEVEIGRFGEHKPYTLSLRPSDTHRYDTIKDEESGDIEYKKIESHNIQILEEPTVSYDFENVANVATVLSEKSDSGASCLTLKDLFNMQMGNEAGMKLRRKLPDIWTELESLIWKDETHQKYRFPIVIIRDALYTNVNNERNYKYGEGEQFENADIFIKNSPTVAPNTSLEYAIIDYDSVAMEGGEVIETTYNFNDMSPVTDAGIYNKEGILERKSTKKLKVKDIVNAELVVYKRAIKLLKQSRRNYYATMNVSRLPADVKVGDKIRLIYTNKIWNLDACSNYWKKLIQKDDWYYVTKIEYNIDAIGGETDKITVSKQLKIERETENNGY